MPWALLAVGSVASVAANVAVAEPTATGRVIAAWQSYALIGSYELLMRQVGRTAARPPRAEVSVTVAPHAIPETGTTEQNPGTDHGVTARAILQIVMACKLRLDIPGA